MFVASKEVTDDYCTWLFSILENVEKQIKISTNPYQERVLGLPLIDFQKEAVTSNWNVDFLPILVSIPTFGIVNRVVNAFTLINV